MAKTKYVYKIHRLIKDIVKQNKILCGVRKRVHTPKTINISKGATCKTCLKIEKKRGLA